MPTGGPGSAWQWAGSHVSAHATDRRRWRQGRLRGQRGAPDRGCDSPPRQPTRDGVRQEVMTMYVIRERLFRLGEDSDITDEAGQPVLHVDGKVLSLHNRLILQDPAGREIGQVHRKLAALRPTYEITIDGKDVAEVRKHLFTPFYERFTIDVPGPSDLEINGDLLDHEFTIERDGQTVATISKRWLSMTASYAVDVAPGEDDVLILASVLALDLAIDAEHDD